jgi:hypothetical protein
MQASKRRQPEQLARVSRGCGAAAVLMHPMEDAGSSRNLHLKQRILQSCSSAFRVNLVRTLVCMPNCDTQRNSAKQISSAYGRCSSCSSNGHSTSDDNLLFDQHLVFSSIPYYFSNSPFFPSPPPHFAVLPQSEGQSTRPLFPFLQ